MSVSTIDRPVSALRQRMLDDMAMRGLRSDTQRDYIRVVRSFAAFLGRSPDTATAAGSQATIRQATNLTHRAAANRQTEPDAQLLQPRKTRNPHRP